LSNQDDNEWVDVVNLVLSKAKVVSEEYEQVKTSMNILKPSYLIRMNEKIYSKAVLQFLDNAYKFSSKGTVHITMIWAKNSFRLKISNPCEVNPQLVMGAKKKFELKQENSGLGLGYLIGQKAMKDSKGQVSTDYDEESKVFEVLLDLPYITKKLISELPNNLKLETLLIVDDNKINRKVLGRIGEQFGYQVFFAETGLSGVKHFIKIKPDIVFMDIQMPVMDGLQSTELIRKYELKNHLERSCILGITAHGTHLYEDKCKAAGMDFMVNKPVKKDQIQDAILSMTTNR
jgi:two-component system, sensor histidine kinase